MHPNQGVPILIEALPASLRRGARGAVRAGRRAGRGGAAYRAQLGAYGDRLIVLTGQTPEQVVALSRRADVLVHPRLACRENYSVQSKIAVYLAAGRPIVATDFGDYQPLLGATGAGPVDRRRPRSRWPRHHQSLDRPRAGAPPGGRHWPGVAREYFAMDRNIDRYLDVYDQALRRGSRSSDLPSFS